MTRAAAAEAAAAAAAGNDGKPETVLSFLPGTVSSC